MTRQPKIRLYVQAALSSACSLTLEADQSRYLHSVMRCRAGDEVLLFNGADGEWRARVAAISKRNCDLEAVEQTRQQTIGPDLRLCFAPIKRSPLEFLVQKATELGVMAFQPMLTSHADVKKVNVDRLGAITCEAAEQCGRLDVPAMLEIASLDQILTRWPEGRALMFCDEAGDARPVLETLRLPIHGGSPKPWGIMIGPVGGFSPEEREHIRAHPAAVPVSLGPRILRADTAALVAVALWQAVFGDSR